MSQSFEKWDGSICWIKKMLRIVMGEHVISCSGFFHLPPHSDARKGSMRLDSWSIFLLEVVNFLPFVSNFPQTVPLCSWYILSLMVVVSFILISLNSCEILYNFSCRYFWILPLLFLPKGRKSQISWKTRGDIRFFSLIGRKKSDIVEN